MERSIRRRASRPEPEDDYEDYDTPAEADPEPAPRRRRTADADTPPTRRRASRPDPEDDDPEPAPRRRAERTRDSDPAPRRRRTAETEPAPRRRASRDEADEAPRRAERTRDSDPARQSLRGWGTYSQRKKETSSFPDNFTPSEEQTLIKFLESEPLAVFGEHWLDELDGRKSRTCLGADCPLCEIGDRPRTRVCFNIIDWSNVDKPQVKVWTVGRRVADSLENLATSPKSGPLDREDLYWAVSRTGKGSKTEYTIMPVKQRDLDEDWDRDPLDPEDLDELAENLFDESFIKIDRRSELEEIADQLSD